MCLVRASVSILLSPTIYAAVAGSLGQMPQDWLLGEFAFSMSGGVRHMVASVVYPSEEDVRTSLEGYEAGACLPYQSRTHKKQLWLREHLW